jgi:hypothetical protein
MPASHPSPQISKVTARHAIERIPEVRSGKVDMENSVAGYCSDSSSNSYGKVWALLSTSDGPVQYAGYGDDLRRTRTPAGDFASKSGDLVAQKMSDGFQDIDSNTLRMRPWSSMDTGATYRGSKCATKKSSDCKRSRKCSYRKGVYTRSGKKMRAPSCAKKSRRRRRSRSSSSKKMRLVSRRSSSKKSRRRSSRKKMRKVSAANMLGKDACTMSPGATWVTGKKGSRVGYCKKVKRSRRRSRSGKKMRRVSRSPSTKKSKRSRRKRSCKKMRRVSKCNTLNSGKKKSAKACKRSRKCSWRKGTKNRKGSCARKARRSR